MRFYLVEDSLIIFVFPHTRTLSSNVPYNSSCLIGIYNVLKTGKNTLYFRDTDVSRFTAIHIGGKERFVLNIFEKPHFEKNIYKM